MNSPVTNNSGANNSGINKHNHKSILTAWIRFVSFVLVLVLVISLVIRALSWKDTNGPYLSSTDQLYSLDNEVVDAIFVGSSHVYCGIYPSVIWAQYGFSTFDMAISGQVKENSYHSIVEVCKTQSPKVVFVDVYSLVYDGFAVEGNLYRNSIPFKVSANAYALQKKIVPEKDLQDHFFKFPIYHTRYAELEKYDFYSNPVNERLLGEYYSNVVNQFIENDPSAKYTTSVATLSDKNLQWLKDLYDLSIAENFELVLMLVPHNVTAEWQSIYNGAKQFAAERGIEFIDFNQMKDTLGLDPDTDYVDYGHLNYRGACKLSSWLGDWLAVNSSLADHRGDSAYHAWEENQLVYSHYMDKFSLAQTEDLADALEIVTRNPSYIAVLSLEVNDPYEAEEYASLMQSLGISKDSYINGGKWLWQNGSIRKILDNDPMIEPICISVNSTDMLRIHYDSYLSPSNILLGFTPYNFPDRPLSLFVYDTLLEEVVFSGRQI